MMLVKAKMTDNKKPALGGFLVVASGNFATTRSLKVVPRDGVEPPTRGFSILCSTD
ncbi:exported protein of unknown function [Pseudomonas inefficax]|uniref:Uncharacterized protein n=1 Tax=Pseudomonas inefficax TaxID=2078786 RepID=A0AAQ1SRM0_9PSED|nr:exported protein of unknown function [Pseudomonas inefficax]